MITRSRSIRQLTQINAEEFNSTSNANEKKKRKEKPTESPIEFKRRNVLTKIDDEQKKSKPNPLSTIADDRMLDTQKNSRKSKRTATITQVHDRQTRTKPTKSHEDAQQKSNGQVPTTETISCHNAIEQVLTRNYIDVQKRLKLVHPAKCTKYLVECCREHSRNAVSDCFLSRLNVNVDFFKHV